MVGRGGWVEFGQNRYFAVWYIFFPFLGLVETSSPDTACLLGIKKADNPFTPVETLKLVTDFQ